MRYGLLISIAMVLLSCRTGSAQDLGWPPGATGLHRPDTLSLYIVGDIMSHGAQTRSAFRSGRADYSTFFRHLESRIAGADAAIGNMEFPLAGKPYTGYPAFSAPDEYAQYLSDLGFDVLLTANNHILDRGPEGLSRTLDRLDSLPLRHTGCARADSLLQPLIINVKGVRIGILNFTYGTNQGATFKGPVVARQKESDLQRLTDACADADLVFAFPHWGIEYRSVHSAPEEATATWLAERGVDLIVGTHPHVVQDCALLEGGVPVFYSLGNAVSNQNDLPARLELGLKVRVVSAFGEAPRLLDVQAEYLWCTKPGMLEPSYATIPVKEFIGRREEWKVPSDYDNMLRTYQAVQEATGIPDGCVIRLQ